MNRILTRPMFRLGGSTNGIMTGLDTPKRGLVNEPGSYSVDEDKISDDENKILGQYLSEANLAKKLTDKIYPKQGTDLNQFLINFGLDLMSRSPQGGFLSTAASAAKAPTQQLYQDIASQKASRRDLETGLFGTLVKARTDLADANQFFAKEKNALNAKEQLDFLNKAINDYNEEKIDEQELFVKAKEVEFIAGIYGIKVGDLPLYTGDGAKSTLDDIEQDLIRDNSSLNEPQNRSLLTREMEKEFNRRKARATIEALTGLSIELKKQLEQEDQEDQEGEAFEEKAEGGRIGYQNAGPVMPSAMPSNMPAPGIMSKAPENMDQGSTEPGISYDELRARLPSEITDDIVRLISESPQALEDFATIQSQQDVNNFNTKYGVNLTLPPEA
jgi:hypothetical protein